MLIKTRHMLETQGKGTSLLLAMVLGALAPQAHIFSFLIQYFLILMLFFAFLDIEFKPGRFQKSVLWIMVANAAVAFSVYLVLVPFDLTLALSAFMTGIAPTAIAAPVIIGFIQREVEYVVAAVLVTNLASAVIVPVALPALIGAEIRISVWEVLQPVLLVMFLPLFLAWMVSRLSPDTKKIIRKGKVISFPVWLANLFIISSHASYFLRTDNSNSPASLVMIALISLVICILNFSLGALLGGRRHWQEASQSLGQKNLSFVIWIALTFVNPLVAMGPMFYIVYHHVYNSWSIYQFEKRRSALLNQGFVSSE